MEHSDARTATTRRRDTKVLMFCAALCLVNYCWGYDETSQKDFVQRDNPIEPLGSSSSLDLEQDASIWRLWRPWKLWRWGRNMINEELFDKSGPGRYRFHQDQHEHKLKKKVKLQSSIPSRVSILEAKPSKKSNWDKTFMCLRQGMFYLDSQKTITRRESSLIVSEQRLPLGDGPLSTTRAQSTARVSESAFSLVVRPKGSVLKELVTLLFESMLDSIVYSWEIIVQQKPEENTPNMDFGRTPSDLTSSRKKGKGKESAKPKAKRSRSKIELGVGLTEVTENWWSGSDERVQIRFRNGNMYEGSLAMKCMHGEGRFQWADGTVYLGQFKDNEMNGKGKIQWKDDTWYEGDFVGNLRHGHGLYVDSRRQRSYAGGWHCATKHGQGVIYYSENFRNSYDGEWNHNVRHGFGSREYCENSGYEGEWDYYVREGKGLMIWPNHDFYRGDWKNGVMSGYGFYVWDSYYNNSMSLPSINAYRGQWLKGKRHGYGVLNLGLGLGSHYKGEFKNNLKHGVGKLVTNNGLILRHKDLFIDDNLGSIALEGDVTLDAKSALFYEPFKFDICDDTVGLLYHIQQALKNVDKQKESRAAIINEFSENNKYLEKLASRISRIDEDIRVEAVDISDLINFEETSLRKSLQCYETELRRIYYRYATICNDEQINFTPVLIRMYLWQLYFDCNIHEKGLTLVQIDKMFFRNPEWIARTAHNPFEKIYFWQFLHSLITVAQQLYAKRHFPGTKPDTILASAFRTFMDNDILPGTNNCRGYLLNGYGSFVPLKALYQLYRGIGEPHSARAFLCAARRTAHDAHRPPPPRDAPAPGLPLGRNAYVFGDEMTFVIDDPIETASDDETTEEMPDLKLFNFGNLSSRAIIKIFAQIFPKVLHSEKIIDLDIEITFYEFFEAFISCTAESIRLRDEELCWWKLFTQHQEETLESGRAHSVMHPG